MTVNCLSIDVSKQATEQIPIEKSIQDTIVVIALIIPTVLVLSIPKYIFK